MFNVGDVVRVSCCGSKDPSCPLDGLEGRIAEIHPGYKYAEVYLMAKGYVTFDKYSLSLKQLTLVGHRDSYNGIKSHMPEWF